MFSDPDNDSKTQTEDREELKRLLWDAHLKKANLGRIKTLLQTVDLTEKEGPYQSSILHMAVSFKVPIEIFQLMVDAYRQKEISLDIQDGSFRTVLDSAFILGHTPVIKILLQEEGVDHNRRMHPMDQKTYFEYFRKSYPKKAEEVDAYLNFLNPTSDSSLLNSVYTSFLWMLGNSRSQAVRYERVPQQMSANQSDSQNPNSHQLQQKKSN